MNRAGIEESVLRSIAETLNIAPERLTAQTSFASGLDADAVAMIDVLMALEETFGVNLVDRYPRDAKTVGDVVGFVVAQLDK